MRSVFFCLLIAIWLPKAALSAGKDTCFTGVYMKSIHDLQPIDFSFGADFYLWLSCAHRAIPLEKIDIVNCKQLERLHPTSDTDGNNLISYDNCKGKFHHAWNIEDYPFDRQSLKIKVEYEEDTSKLILLPDKNGFNTDELSIPGWEITGTQIIDSVHTYRSDFGSHNTYKGKSAYSTVIFVVNIKRDSLGLFFKLFAGLYIAFLVSFVSFFVSTKNHIDPRFGLSIGGLFAAVANNYVVDSNIPPSNRFSFVDWIHLITFLFILITLLASSYSLYHNESGRHEKSIKFNERWRWVFLGLYVLVNAILITKVNMS